MDFEQAIIDAIVREFFKVNPGGNVSNGNLYYINSPATSVALALFEKRKDDILAAVTKELDVDALAKSISAKIVTGLTDRGWLGSYQGDQFTNDLRKAVIDKVAATQAQALMESLPRLPADA
jgi:hypothetical protein